MSGEMERFEPRQSRGRIAYEHFHRYSICREMVRDREVLDMACGAGYGSSLLAQVAKSVHAIDIDEGAINRARDTYQRPNLQYQTADCFSLPFKDGSFDTVIANEIIEHIEDHDRFVREAKRVIRRGGIALISTPNRPIYNRYKSPNRFHVSEMDQVEFEQLLGRHFARFRLLGCRMALQSASYPIRSENTNEEIFARVFQGHYDGKGDMSLISGNLRLDEPEYFLAICSDEDLPISDFESSIYLTRNDDLWAEHEKIFAWASQLHEEDELLRQEVRKMHETESQTRIEQSAALEALKANHAGELATYRQQEQVLYRLAARLAGQALEPGSGSLVEALFLASERITKLESQLPAITRLENELAEQSAMRTQISAELERASAEARSREEALATAIQAERTLTDEKQHLISLIDEQRATIESERAAFHEATLKLEEGLHKISAAREADEKLGKEQRRLIQTIASETGFARIHADVVHQLETASTTVRRTLAQPGPASRLPTSIMELKRRFARPPAAFLSSWLTKQHPELDEAVSWKRYCSDSSLFDLDPHPLFSAKYYFSQLPTIDGKIYNPLLHYLSIGWRQSFSPHPFFPNDWYLAQNPDVLAAGINPLEHYLTHGWHENRAANPVFDASGYLARYPDVAREKVDPLLHYLAYGKSEGREGGSKLVDVRALHLLPPEARAKGLLEFLLTDRKVKLAPVEMFDCPMPETTTTPAPSHWPPERLDDYWLPQTLRDHIVTSHGEGAVPLFSYLFSVMNRYRDRGVTFDTSKDCDLLIERAKFLSNLPRRMDGGEETPVASIIIPVYNNLLDTMLCILSVLELRDVASFEIIVGDDCSSDATARVIESIGGCVRHVRQQENKGFLGNCNTAATHAVGQILIFLNNDTIVLPGWLDGLLSPFEKDPRIGLIGSKLLNADGTLQEAGGIFWRDGSAWNFGRDQNADLPQFNYLKDVDYCSGASIAVPTMLWQDLGGFDPIFTPAYCEDSDIAFRIRNKGLRTVLNPASEVVHHEGRSHGRDLSSGVKAYQQINQQKLFERWRDVLELENYPNAENVLRARDRTSGKPHILVIDHYVPQWNQDAGSRTILQFLLTLIEMDFAVTFWPDNLYRDPEYTPHLQNLGIEVIYGPQFLGKFAEFLTERSDLYEFVLLSRPHIAKDFIEDIRRISDARLIYYGHDLHFDRMTASREISSTDQSIIDKMRDLEISVCDSCDVVLYPSQDEIDKISPLIDDRVKAFAVPAYSFETKCLDHARSALTSRAEARGKMILFVGGFAHHPNVDGIQWFCREIAPIIRDLKVDFSLVVVGSRPTDEIFRLAELDIDIRGFVSDEELTSLYEKAALVVAPLRYGAGVKGKVIEAMANGVPVVTTHVGAQGISGSDDLLFLADSADDFAKQVMNTLKDPVAASIRAARALDFVSDQYSRKSIRRIFETATQR